MQLEMIADLEFPPISDFEDTVPDAPRTDFVDVRADDKALAQTENPVDVIQRHYPRVMRQMELLWGTQDMQDKFTRWLLTDQEGRSGWPAEVHDALMSLANNHAILYKLEGTPKWGQPRDRW